MHSLHCTIVGDVRKKILHDFPSCQANLLYRDFELNHHSQLYLRMRMMTSYFCHYYSVHAQMNFYYCPHEGGDDEADRYGYNDEAFVVAVDPQLSMDNFVSDISHLYNKNVMS